MITRRGLISAAALGPRVYAANDRVQIGVIGAGQRGRQLMTALEGLPGAKIVAVCDGREKRHTEILARPDVDAVVIATPDHLHVPMLVDACAAGKDGYVETPLTHNLAEGAPAIAAVRASGRVVQAGLQQRSMPHVRMAREMVRAGKLGKVHRVSMTWNREAGDAAEANWRWFWASGGGVFTERLVHWADLAHWVLDLGHPLEAVAIADSRRRETPETAQCLLRYAGVETYFESTLANARSGAMVEFIGEEGTLYVDRGRWEYHTERGGGYEEMVVGAGRRGAEFYEQPDGERLHLENWLECVRSRREPVAPVEAGVMAAAAGHLANLALRSGKTAPWNLEGRDVSQRRWLFM